MSNFEYRHFVYLDTEEIMNVAVSIDGGETLSDVRTLTKQLGGKFAADLGFKVMGASLSLGGQGGRAFKQELQVRHTAYTAVNKVLEKLDPNKFTTSDDIHNRRVEEGQVIKCRVVLQLPCAVEGTPDKSLLFRRRDRRQPFQAKYGIRQDVVVEAPDGKRKEAKDAVVILALRPEWLLKPDEFTRRATVIGQVVGVRGIPDEVLRQSDTLDQGDWTLDFGTSPISAATDSAESAQELALNTQPPAAPEKMAPAPKSEKMMDRGSRDATSAVLRIRPIAIFK